MSGFIDHSFESVLGGLSLAVSGNPRIAVFPDVKKSAKADPLPESPEWGREVLGLLRPGGLFFPALILLTSISESRYSVISVFQEKPSFLLLGKSPTRIFHSV
jgi:hypothetical protein